MDYPQFQPGQKVANQFGKVLTVLHQRGCQVFVAEECNSHYHPTKLHPIKQPSTPSIATPPSPPDC